MEEPQELSVTNTGQPQVVDITPAEEIETPLDMAVTTPVNVTVTISPITD